MVYNTFGWDTVYVIDVNLVNAALRRERLPELEYTSDGTEMTGVMGSMQIVSGGSGKLLRMSFQVAQGSLVSKTVGDASLDGVTLVADLELTLLPSGMPTSQNLVPDIRKVSQQAGPGLLTPVNLLDPGKHLTPAQHALVFALLPQFLVSVAPQITFVLATVNFARPATDSWLAPVKADYAFMNKNDGSNYLGILAVTTDRDVSNLQRTIDDQIVSGSNNAGLFIAESLFMENVIVPVLERAYPDAGRSNFYWNGREVKARRSFGAGSVKKGAITYHPKINSFNLTLVGGTLDTSLSGDCDMKAGIRMSYNASSRNSSRFDMKNKLLTFTSDPHPRFHKDVHIPWYWIVGGAVVEVIVQLVARLIGNAIANALQGGQGVKLARTPPASIQWSHTTNIDVKSAGLNGLFYMQGTAAPQ
ncbi:hypothetical protein Nwi_0887 [Nitrobacter winogradskyi Nb-255]|uniref:Protein OrfX2/OrfX3/P47 domain-containing protein n=1 Tax=Nitrobacter winogradskyi (strain ATCC 25391 / DSM 10237 / CIP 104748 / NCIMB 11846 / Nb-255) TaxID=323098 RepID=Q3SU90_NITWN|nr:TULIP family P47-like protein [Nitrobacter winogradskyi]ABA04151.1 hypothetical protein Nwi_0887 [Nitrobacter winogradskyi Nb-255]